MAFEWVVFVLFWSTTNAGEVDLLECEPPDIPRYGGYGPTQDFYTPGDVIHYYCDTDTFMSGHFYRRCEDTGDWSGNTPICDRPSSFSSITQSSTVDEQSTADMAIDLLKTTCTSTKAGTKGEWSGIFTVPGRLVRVKLFLGKGPVSLEVVLVKANGEEIVCGSKTINVDRYLWTIQDCPEPHDTDASGIKIRSLTTAPLQICEIQAYALKFPWCRDPHLRIENGRIRLDRHSATLVCNEGFTRSPDNTLECVSSGVWNKKPLYCIEHQWEVNPRSSSDRETDN